VLYLSGESGFVVLIASGDTGLGSAIQGWRGNQMQLQPHVVSSVARTVVPAALNAHRKSAENQREAQDQAYFWGQLFRRSHEKGPFAKTEKNEPEPSREDRSI
jgi:hypothetical protein